MSSNQYRLLGDAYSQLNVTPRRWPKRLMIFSAVFLPLLLATQIYVFSQPAIYLSEASVLTTAATDVDQSSPDADLQHVSIQKELLLGEPLLKKATEQLLPHDDGRPWTVDELRSMFAVTPVEGTNLLKLSAEGSDPIWLRRTLNAWLEAYRQARADYVAEISDKVTTALSDELTRIDNQVARKRQEIDDFRLAHNILSVESTDNQAHARLQGLNQSLNKAIDEEVKAKAKMDAIHAAIAEGKPVVPEDDSRTLSVMVEQAERLREKLASLHGQYTDEYIKFNPALRKIPEELAELEAKIDAKLKSGGGIAVQEAESNYAAAHQAVLTIQRQMAEHKQLAADYTSQFTKHQALQEELKKLETLQQDTKQRLADIEVKQRQKYPQVQVIDSASLPSKPIRPNYWQESATAFAACLALGLLAVWIGDYLRREEIQSVPASTLEAVAAGRLRGDPRTALDGFSAPRTVTVDAFKALENDITPRELTYPETAALFAAADHQARQLLSMLLNGLSIAEILSLSGESFDIAQSTITVPLSRRTLGMTQMVKILLSANGWKTISCSDDECNALLSCAAIDGGLATPEQIRSETISYTYALFLIRQGIKLTDLPKVVGPLSPSRLLMLGKFSPEGPGIPLEQIDLDYLKVQDAA